MQTERFNKLRREVLSSIFEKESMAFVWRKIVKNQLRALDLKDLFDHYDFNYNIEQRALAIRNEILNGSYKVSQPLIYRIEKKFGVCRHIVVPHPTDALVLQILVESFADKILSNQPSENAFYTRDKHNLPKPHEMKMEYNLSWRQQWKKLQKKIYKFNEEKELIIVTDLANYFDSIDIKQLRKVFTSYGKIDEVIVDLLFRILEEISWKPDYLPYSQRGLPTVNIEAIRLLGHSFLFELDEVIKQKTNNSFTRWMDDIVIGVDSRKEAIEIISSISDVLKSRGLAINLAKTDIYNAKAAYYHFQIEENHYLDSIENVKTTDPRYNEVVKELTKRFEMHFNDQNAKYWDKISKRYITAFGKLKAPELLLNIPQLYIDYPALRSHLLMYLSKIGYNKESAKRVLEILKQLDVFDDISLYQLCNLVTAWEIPVDTTSRRFLLTFERRIISFSFNRKLPSDFYCVLWFKAKYSHPEALLAFVTRYRNIWQTNSFLRRQVTAVLSRLLITNSTIVSQLLYTQISSGVTSTVTLANQLFQFSTLSKLDKKLNYYLFPSRAQRPYPLAKFLVLCTVLSSSDIRSNDSVRRRIRKQINDPYYIKWLDAQYNVN